MGVVGRSNNVFRYPKAERGKKMLEERTENESVTCGDV
jgi:hypothetical protein